MADQPSNDAPLAVTLTDQGNAATTAGFSSVLIAWQAPVAPASTITGYSIAISSVHAGVTQPYATIAVNNTTSTVLPLAADQVYVATVNATYANGTGGRLSALSPGLTLPVDSRPPAPVANVQPPVAAASPQPSVSPGGQLVPQVNTFQAGANMVLILKLDGQEQKKVVLPVNPEDLNLELPSRSSVVNTLGGAYQEAWGAGVGSLTFAGTTGWRDHHDGQGDGHQLMMLLLELHRTYQNQTAAFDPSRTEFDVILPPFPGVNAPGVLQVVVGGQSRTGNEGMYVVSSDTLKVQRNKSSPLLYRYQWTMTVLEDKMYPAVSPSKRFALATATGGSQPASVTSGLAAPAAAAISGAASAVSSAVTNPPGTTANPRATHSPNSIGANAVPGAPVPLSPVMVNQLAPLPVGLYAVGNPSKVSQVIQSLSLPAADVGGFLGLNQLSADVTLQRGTTLSVPPALDLVAA